MNFTLRQITYFLAVARFGSFGAAANAVHVSQPGLSSQIAELETRLGGQLFHRSPGAGRVVLTQLGERLLPIATELTETAERLAAAARAPRPPLSGRLRLGIIPTVAPYLIPLLIPAVRNHHAQAALELHEAMTDELLDNLVSNRLDAGILALPIDQPGIMVAPVLRDPFLIAVAENDDMWLAGPAQPDTIETDRLLLLADGHCLREQALEVCGRREPRRQMNLEATSMATLMRMVAAGMGMTLVPQLALAEENHDGRLRVIPFAEPAPKRDLAVIWRRGSPAEADARALADIVRGLADRLGVAALSDIP